jgi:hypothetical protein
MLISGNNLPVLSRGLAEQKQAETPESIPRKDKQSGSRQPPAEYIFRGQIDDESYRPRSPYSQPVNVDPANSSAINRYVDTEINSPYKPQKQGRLLDIFI